MGNEKNTNEFLCLFILFFCRDICFVLKIMVLSAFYIPSRDNGRVSWFQISHLYVHLSVHLPLSIQNFCLWTITLVNINGFSPNLVCALIMWRSGMGLLTGKFCQFLQLVTQ